MEGLTNFEVKNLEVTNLDELKELLESALKAIEVLDEKLMKINNFELKVIQKSSSR